LRRLDSDFAEIALAVAQGQLSGVKRQWPRWSKKAATCVVMASGGYPGNYSTGKTITGIDEAERVESVMVFHAGTKLGSGGEIETAGGRVLGVTACAAALQEATSRVYEAVGKIQFDGMQFRRDIGRPNQ
jgi:phosphoribosylamine---glycine ligase